MLAQRFSYPVLHEIFIGEALQDLARHHVLSKWLTERRELSLPEQLANLMHTATCKTPVYLG